MTVACKARSDLCTTATSPTRVSSHFPTHVRYLGESNAEMLVPLPLPLRGCRDLPCEDPLFPPPQASAPLASELQLPDTANPFGSKQSVAHVHSRTSRGQFLG